MDYTVEEHKSKLFYRVKYIQGENAKASTKRDYHNSVNLFFIYFISGHGKLHIENSSFEIKTGDVILLNPSELFWFDIENNCYHERIVLSANIRMIKSFPCDYSSVFSSLYKRKAGTSNVISSDTVKEYGLDRLFRELLDYAREEGQVHETLSICKAIEILCWINKIIEFVPSSSANFVTKDTLVNRILDYINKHYTEDICIQNIADHFNVHRSHLLHKFKSQMSLSLWDYVIRCRIRKFNSMINENTSVEEAAYSVGFKNYSNFYRLYKKNMGTSPLEFKRQLREVKQVEK